MGAVVGDDVEQQRHQGRTRGLAYETRRSEHAAGASAPLVRSRGDQDAVVGRLEKPEAGTAEHQPPYDVARCGVFGQECQQEQSRGHGRQPRPAEQSGVDALDEHSGHGSHDHDHGRPCGHQQPCRHFVVAEFVLQVERQRYHGQHLPQERADRRDDRNRKDRDAQQVERQDRIGLAQLAADEEEPDDEQRCDAQGEQPRVEPVRKPFDRSHQQAEGQGVHYGVAPVETACAHPHGIVRQEAAAQPQRHQPDGDVHGEEPRPLGDGEDARSQRRPGDRRHGDDRGVDAHAASQLRLGVDDADKRGVDRCDGRGAEPLHHARQHQRRE